jgi:5-(carboxyamino)imidazole ribonucleotide synthase
MVNLLGEAGHEGLARYEGLEEIMKIAGVHVHLYGKRITKPFRKMGHVTILDEDIASLRNKAAFVKQTLKVVA